MLLAGENALLIKAFLNEASRSMAYLWALAPAYNQREASTHSSIQGWDRVYSTKYSCCERWHIKKQLKQLWRWYKTLCWNNAEIILCSENSIKQNIQESSLKQFITQICSRTRISSWYKVVGPCCVLSSSFKRSVALEDVTIQAWNHPCCNNPNSTVIDLSCSSSYMYNLFSVSSPSPSWDSSVSWFWQLTAASNFFLPKIDEHVRAGIIWQSHDLKSSRMKPETYVNLIPCGNPYHNCTDFEICVIPDKIMYHIVGLQHCKWFYPNYLC